MLHLWLARTMQNLAIQPNLEWKTQSKQLWGYLPLGAVFPGYINHFKRPLTEGHCLTMLTPKLQKIQICVGWKKGKLTERPIANLSICLVRTMPWSCIQTAFMLTYWSLWLITISMKTVSSFVSGNPLRLTSLGKKNIFVSIKSGWSELVSTRRSNVQILPLK